MEPWQAIALSVAIPPLGWFAFLASQVGPSAAAFWVLAYAAQVLG